MDEVCFTGILQIELDNIKEMWNSHRIRNSRNAKYPGGRPDILYVNSAAVGTTDYKFSLAGGKLDQALRFCVYPSLVNCAEDFLSLASLIMIEENLRAPKNTQEAKFLFPRLITVTDSWQFQNYDYLKCLVTLSHIIQEKRLFDYRKLFLYFMLSDEILFKNCPTRRAKCAQNVLKNRNQLSDIQAKSII